MIFRLYECCLTNVVTVEFYNQQHTDLIFSTGSAANEEKLVVEFIKWYKLVF